MSLAAHLKTLISVYEMIKSSISGHSVRVSNAIEKINDAFIDTYDYLVNKKGEYKSNPALAKQWNTAATSVRLINPDLGSLLMQKSKFWTYPDKFFELNRHDDVITLNRIIDEMERLTMKLRK